MHVRNASSVGSYGLGVRIPNEYWVAGQWVTATTTYTDDTTDAQDAGTTDFALETLTNNDGHIIWSQYPFNAVSYDIGTASVAGAGYAHVFEHTDEEGDGWVTMAANNFHVNDFGTAGIPVTGTTVANEALLVFDVPTRWGRATSALAGTGMRPGYYGLRVTASDAPDTAAVADSLSIYRLYFLTEAVADNGTLSQDFGCKDFPMAVDTLPGRTPEMYGDALVALFETADEGNRITALVRGR